MNDRISFETAKVLKEAGFPQPKPEAGQYWYNSHGQLYWIQSVEGEYCTVRLLGVSGHHGWTTRFDGWIFAPKALDILAELPNCSITFSTGQWIVFFTGSGDYASDYFDNPAEAAALAWLELNKK